MIEEGEDGLYGVVLKKGRKEGCRLRMKVLKNVKEEIWFEEVWGGF